MSSSCCFKGPPATWSPVLNPHFVICGVTHSGRLLSTRPPRETPLLSTPFMIFSVAMVEELFMGVEEELMIMKTDGSSIYTKKKY